MLNKDFYNHKAAVLMVQSTMQNILEEKGLNAEGLQIHEMLPLLRALNADLSFITATAADILEGKISVDSAGNKITGTLVPQSGGGGSMDFYKCAAVAGEEKEPIPEPVFAEKFNGTLTNDFTQLGEAPEYSTIDGRQGMKCDYAHRLSTSCDGFPGGNAPRTMSAWLYCNSGSLSGEWNMFCIYGSADGFGMRAYNGELYADGTAWQPYETIGDLSENVWQHIVLVGEGDKTVGYINGIKSGEVTYELETVLTGGLQIGYQYGDDSAYSTDAYISDLQIYDVALSAEQVTKLYEGIEDTPPLPANTWNGYKAVLVTETVTTEGETVLIVSGSGIADGNYKLMDSTATGNSRIWKHTDSEWYLVWTGSMWVINASPTYERGQEAFYPDTTGDENPWDVTTWWGDDGIVNMTITQQTTEGTSEIKKYYEFEETLTEGLTYGKGFTPVVDKVYDSEAMITATLSEKIKYPEIASPMNMTGYTKDDWIVSESDYRFDSTRAWNAFYPNGIWAGFDWIQWQNTAQQVLVRQITFGYGGNSNWIYSCRLDGSDDGEHWTEIGTRDCEYEGEDNETILTYPENETAYYYHRLVVLSSNGCAVVWKLLAKREIDGRNNP